MSKRVAIVSGGHAGDWVLAELRPDDVLVGADRGALFLVQQGLAPMLALGDFDSVNEEELALIRLHSKEVRSCDPIDKDFTDTELAFRWALEAGADEMVLLGVLGTRFDHTLANVHLLKQALKSGIRCSIVDERNRIRLADRELTVERSRFTQVSLLPLSERVTGITIEGFKYPLHDAELCIGQSLGISNVLAAEQGTVRIGSGMLLVIESRD